MGTGILVDRCQGCGAKRDVLSNLDFLCDRCQRLGPDIQRMIFYRSSDHGLFTNGWECRAVCEEKGRRWVYEV